MEKFESRGQRQTLAAKFGGSSPMPSSLTSTTPRNLPPIGVFWDIENCQVPKGKSALAVAQFIRKRFFIAHREAEFMCVCDINKESKEVIQELNNAQVTVVHINATCKNAADDKLRQSMRRFADIHGYPATIILISGDVNFAADLSDLNHRRRLNIIVLHNNCAPKPLLACAHQHFVFSSLLAEIPVRTPVRPPCQSSELLVGNLPYDQNPGEIRKRLKQLSDNCGGRVISITHRKAIVRFPTIEAATRAKKRMDREDVFGNKISVNFCSRSELGEMEKISGRPIKRSSHGSEDHDGLSPSRQPNGTKGFKSSPLRLPRMSALFSLPPPDTDMADVVLPPWLERMVAAQQSNRIRVDKETAPSPMLWRPASEDPHSKCSSTTSTGSSLGSRDVTLLPDTHMGKSFGFLQEKSSPSHRRSKRRHSCLPYCVSQDRTSHSQPSFPCVVTPPLFSNKENSWSKVNGKPACDQNGLPKTGITPLRCLTPVPSRISNVVGSCSPETESFFQPIVSNGEDHVGTNVHSQQPVELMVTNLDQSLDSLEMKETLLNAFRQHVMVLQIGITNNPESSKMAMVKVPSIQDAQYAISQLHRRKIGFKRIVISIASGLNCNSPSLAILKSEVMSLLNDVPGGKIPLFKFRELFERRYHQSISSAELNRMRDIIIVKETSAGRMVTWNFASRDSHTPSPTSSEDSKEVQAIMEVSYCEIHCANPNIGKGWAEKESSKTLPFVRFSLKALSMHVHKLLETHNGILPLGSFPVCYGHEFGPLAVDDGGIPLEHLIAAVPGVLITQNAVGGKRIQWTENLGPPEIRSTSPPLAAQLALFSREVVDLLKNHSRCLILFSKFIPAYHHHFGRQCRVADYGFTKLIELFEAVPHVVQVLGEGNKRFLTLTHRVQMKRFSADLLRVLKSQASKQVVLDDLPIIYTKCLGKEFDITDYGVCEVADMLSSLAENTIVVTSSESETLIAIPKREQTNEEIERTKHFAEEVLELLRHSPRCRMSFNKFIPAYHHHFGRQCRVSDYGFTKLIELLEAIPHVIKIIEEEEEKMLLLSEEELLKVLSDQVAALVESSPGSVLPLHSFVSSFTQFHGHSINLMDFDVDSIANLLKKIDSVEVIPSSEGPSITLVDSNFLRHVGKNVCDLLVEQAEGALSWVDFQEKYQERFGDECSMQAIKQLSGIVQVNEAAGWLQLVPLQMFARDVQILLPEYNNSLPLQQFETAYAERFGRPCQPTVYGFPSIASLLLAIPDIVHLRGRRNKRVILLSKQMAGTSLGNISCSSSAAEQEMEDLHPLLYHRPSSADSAVPDDDELLQMYSPVDLLSIPVPSCVPSPCLQPSCLQLASIDEDLMRFDSPVASFIAAEKEQDATPGSSASKSLAAQDPMTAASSLLRSLMLSSPPPTAPGAKIGAFAQENNTTATSTCSPPRTAMQMTSTPNGSPVQLNCGPLPPDLVPVHDSKLLVQSCEDLSCTNEVPVEETMAISSQSTPTHQVLKRPMSQRSRLAAHFSNLPIPDD